MGCGCRGARARASAGSQKAAAAPAWLRGVVDAHHAPGPARWVVDCGDGDRTVFDDFDSAAEAAGDGCQLVAVI